MNRADPSKTILFTGFLASLVLHILVWGVASGFVKIGNVRPDKVKAHQAAQPPKVEPRVRLGIDKSEAHTLTWLGFSEPTEHSGPLSAVEQSAMTPQAGSPSTPAPPAPQTAPTKLTPPAPTPAKLASSQVQEEAQNKAGVGPKLAPPAPPVRTAAAPDPAPNTSANNPAPTNPAPGTPGVTADKESIASAIKKAPKVVMGQTVAAEGLDIQTKSPKFSMTTLQTRRPSNPTVQITFGRDGKVIRAGFATEGKLVHSTGYDDVDEPLLSAIYTWTAKGKRLAELTSKDPSGEVTILITILFNG